MIIYVIQPYQEAKNANRDTTRTNRAIKIIVGRDNVDTENLLSTSIEQDVPPM